MGFKKYLDPTEPRVPHVATEQAAGVSAVAQTEEKYGAVNTPVYSGRRLTDEVFLTPGNHEAYHTTNAWAISLSGSQSIANGTITQLGFNTLDYDPDGICALSQTFYYPTPTRPGLYLVMATVRLVGAGANNYRTCYISVAIDGSINRHLGGGNPNGGDTIVMSGIAPVAVPSAGHQVNMFIYQNQGGARTVDVAYFQGFYLGDIG